MFNGLGFRGFVLRGFVPSYLAGTSPHCRTFRTAALEQWNQAHRKPHSGYNCTQSSTNLGDTGSESSYTVSNLMGPWANSFYIRESTSEHVRESGSIRLSETTAQPSQKCRVFSLLPTKEPALQGMFGTVADAQQTLSTHHY